MRLLSTVVVKTNLSVLKRLKPEVRNKLAQEMHNLRIIHVVNSSFGVTDNDTYFICANAKSEQTNPGIGFSVYDMTRQKFTMLHYVDVNDMAQNNMSFDYNDYNFGMKRKNLEEYVSSRTKKTKK